MVKNFFFIFAVNVGFSRANSPFVNLLKRKTLKIFLFRGNFSLDRIELHGTQEELEALKPDMDPLGAIYFVKKGEAISLKNI